MKKRIISCLCYFALPGLAAFLLIACVNKTEVEKTWVAPNIGSLHFTKVFVFAMAKDDTNWRLAEIAVRDQINKVPAVSSHDVLPDIADVRDKSKLFQAIKDSGADGLVTVRLAYRDLEVSTGATKAVPMEYQIFNDYYGAVYDVGAYYSMDRRDINADSIYGIVTNIYDAKTGKLLWSGQTRSTKTMDKSHDVKAIMTEVAETIQNALQSEGLIR
jgi:hypothetical protein